MELEFHLTLHCRKCMCLAPSLNTQVPVSALKRKQGRNAGTVIPSVGTRKGSNLVFFQHSKNCLRVQVYCQGTAAQIILVPLSWCTELLLGFTRENMEVATRNLRHHVLHIIPASFRFMSRRSCCSSLQAGSLPSCKMGGT